IGSGSAGPTRSSRASPRSCARTASASTATTPIPPRSSANRRPRSTSGSRRTVRGSYDERLGRRRFAPPTHGLRTLHCLPAPPRAHPRAPGHGLRWSAAGPVPVDTRPLKGPNAAWPAVTRAPGELFVLHGSLALRGFDGAKLSRVDLLSWTVVWTTRLLDTK